MQPMKTTHTAIVGAAMVAVLVVALIAASETPSFVSKNVKAHIKSLATLWPPASEQSARIAEQVTSSTLIVLLSGLSFPVDPLHETVLIGRARVDDMIIQLELEPAKAMPTVSGSPPKLTEHAIGEDELYHVKVTLIDPRSNTRISHTSVVFQAVNEDNGRKVEAKLQPMWSRSGLHYALNSGLAGDGVYESKIIVGVPRFARDPRDQDRWVRPVTAKFDFRLAGAKLSEVAKVMERAGTEAGDDR
jgi:hypothetical protein